MPHPDLDWVRRAMTGDALGRNEFVVRLQRVPATLARRNARLGRPLGRSDLEELFQDIAGLVWSKLPDYAGRCSFDGWVFRFCDLGLRSRSRRRRRPIDRLLDSEEIAPPVAPQRDILLLEAVTRRLSDLGARVGEVIRLKHFEDRTFSEIASRLGMSENSAKTSYYRGLERLRRWLGPMGRAVTGADEREAIATSRREVPARFSRLDGPRA